MKIHSEEKTILLRDTKTENEFKPLNILFVRFGFSFFYNAKIQLYFGSVIFSSVACNGRVLRRRAS
ncbi:hypothetical protein FIP52_10095 [Riemerella anatipestifer]|nr:hypothetical protein FIP52_10095 [Riemerella anatipestifer]